MSAFCFVDMLVSRYKPVMFLVGTSSGSLVLVRMAGSRVPTLPHWARRSTFAKRSCERSINDRFVTKTEHVN